MTCTSWCCSPAPADSDITGKNCSPYAAHWVYDTYALAHGTGSAIVKQGGKTWYFITANYAFGHALERDTAAVVNASGGKVLGQALVPLNTADFSSYLLQAQDLKALIIGLATLVMTPPVRSSRRPSSGLPSMA